MRIAFMGTPEFARLVLAEIVAKHEVVAVYTAPDSIRKRGKELVPTPVKAFAQENGIQVFTPQNFNHDGTIEELSALNPDIICVAAYAVLLPKTVIEIAPLGCINVHASILPQWRGAAPIERGILNGDTFAGVSIMRMEKGLDTGPYCLQEQCPINDKSSTELTNELGSRGGKLLNEALVLIDGDTAKWTAQPETGWTYAEKIKKHELNLLLEDDALTALRKIQASSEAHPSKVMFDNKPITIISASASDYDAPYTSGNIIISKNTIQLVMQKGAIELDYIKPDGKKLMTAKEFLCGLRSNSQDGLRWYPA